MKPLLPEPLDWKKTSFKKAGVFFRTMDAAQLCATHEKYGLFHITAIHRTQPKFLEALVEAKQRLKPLTAAAAAVAPTPTKEQLRRQFHEGLVQVETLYHPMAATKRLFPGVEKDSLYTAAECAELLLAYIHNEGLDPSVADKSLFKGRKTKIKLNGYLKETLYGKKADPPDAEELMVLEDKLCEALQQWHRIKHPGEEPIVGKGLLRPIQLITEQRQGHKVVTRCLHLDDYGFDLPGLQSALQKKFASAVTLPPPTGGSKGPSSLKYELLAQGHMVTQWADYLLNVLHIPKQFVEVCDKVRR